MGSWPSSSVVSLPKIPLKTIKMACVPPPPSSAASSLMSAPVHVCCICVLCLCAVPV